ncbi:MAG TPA: polyprenyl synthetase family protein [Candidatus Cybelea sp.]|jgi:octaprenyl-diphosphate synthase|nr:polyprenyl synthetase family protein [Candidatus Cybelea sp.]
MSTTDLPSTSADDLHALVERFFRDTFSTDNPIITEAIKRMLAAGGKRLRPRITLLAAECCGGNALEHLHLAAYMELIHVATLIHDDVVDNAATRRGVNATAVDYGNRVSVLAGDYLFAWIFKNVTLNYPHPVPNVLSATLADICDGEVLQLQALGNLDLPLETYVEVARKKTASLFAASAQCGAIMGGGRERDIAALRDFGEAFGVAFQMKDDLLDMIADERSLGKPAGNDLTERKTTIPLIAALASGNRGFRAEVRRFYEGGANDAIPAIVDAIGREGGLTATRVEIARFVERAKGALEPIATSAAKTELLKLTEALEL